MRRNSVSGSAAGSISVPVGKSARNVGRGGLTVVLLGHLTPSLNAVNSMHWTRKAKLRKRYRELLAGSVSPSNVTGRELLTAIILWEDVSS